MGVRILLVATAPVVTDKMRQELDGEGYQLHVANTWAEACRQVDKDKPDLMLLDLMMPATGRTDMPGRLISRGIGCGVPVLLLTTHTPTSEIADLFGAAGALSHPLAPQALLTELARFRPPAGYVAA